MVVVWGDVHTIIPFFVLSEPGKSPFPPQSSLRFHRVPFRICVLGGLPFDFLFFWVVRLRSFYHPSSLLILRVAFLHGCVEPLSWFSPVPRHLFSKHQYFVVARSSFYRSALTVLSSCFNCRFPRFLLFFPRRPPLNLAAFCLKLPPHVVPPFEEPGEVFASLFPHSFRFFFSASGG